MKRLSVLNANPLQTVTYTTESGKNVDMTFRYLPTQMRWVLDLIYDDSFFINGIAVTCHPNILDKWHNILDFGINVTTDDTSEPIEITCFQDKSCFVCMLNEEEKNKTTEYLNGL